MKLNPRQLASKGILTILSLIIIFHLVVMVGIVPYDIVWGGRLKSHEEMIVFETISIAVNLIMIIIVAIHTGLIKVNIHLMVFKVAFWLMFVLFSLNTVGNLLAVNSLEKIIFTPLTLLLAVFSFILAVGRKQTAKV